jgi:hypothetical protein
MQRDWFDAVMAIDPERRAEALAEAFADMVDYLARNDGLDDRIAFVELHNEVQGGHLTDGLTDGDLVVALKPRLERGIARFKSRHPGLPVTANYAGVPVGSLRGIPADVDVAAFHPYVYGVLDELVQTFALRDPRRPFPQERAYEELLRPDAPSLDEWRLPPDTKWRLDATIVPLREMYVHDWCDPDKWDAWLYDRHGTHRIGMHQKLTIWMAAAADYASAKGIPLVFGEGWIGYTPLHANFEEGPVGAAFCRTAVAESAKAGAWGTVVCSNAAPHHPMWMDLDLQRECNAVLRNSRSRR